MSTKRTILLYNPKAVFFDMPLALISIGTQIFNEYNVVIIDARIEDNIDALLNEHIEDTLLVGVTSLTGAPLRDAIDFTRKIKKIDSNIPVVWGGWHTSLFPEQVLNEVAEIDIAVQGQGEITFKELVNALGKNVELESVKGITFRKNGKVVKSPARAMVDMNELPRLNYDLIDVERYFFAKGQRQFDFIASIGCFFRCTFCADPFVFNRKYSGLLPTRLVADLLYYHDKYQFEDLNFQDETFFTYRERIVEMSKQLKDIGTPFSWAATMRADQGRRMGLEELKICKEGGLRRLLIGVESGSQEMMDWLKKDIKLVDVVQCAAWCKEINLQVIFPFIVGFPGETDKSVEESKKVIRQLALMSKKFETPIFYFKPYPGTQITDDVVASGEYTMPESIEDWSEFDYVGSRGPWVDEEKYKFFEKYKFYLRLYRQQRIITQPISALAKWRLKHFSFSLPIEKWVYDKLKPSKKLS